MEIIRSGNTWIILDQFGTVVLQTSQDYYNGALPSNVNTALERLLLSSNELDTRED